MIGRRREAASGAPTAATPPQAQLLRHPSLFLSGARATGSSSSYVAWEQFVFRLCNSLGIDYDDLLSPPPSLPSPPHRYPTSAAKQVAEQIERITTAEATTTTTTALLEPLFSVSIVQSPLLGIPQHFVRPAYEFELGFRFGIVGVFVCKAEWVRV